MRQIKFRVWDKTEDKFIPLKDYHLATIRFDGLPQFFTCDNVLIYGKVWPEHLVLQQFTGLKDKNSIEVYEGDVVELCFCNTPDYKNKTLIEWSDYHNGWAITQLGVPLDSIFRSYRLSLPFITYNSIRVIGNIFENPELLN